MQMVIACNRICTWPPAGGKVKMRFPQLQNKRACASLSGSWKRHGSGVLRPCLFVPAPHGFQVEF